jgi:lysozyme
LVTAIPAWTFSKEWSSQKKDLHIVARQVQTVLQITLNNYQFSALVSLVFNWGIGHFEKSDLLKLIHASKLYEAADEFLKLDHADGVRYAGLTIRREAERNMFLTGIGVLKIPGAP